MVGGLITMVPLYSCGGYFISVNNTFVKINEVKYRSDTVNSNTVNSKFHFIQSFCEMVSYPV